MADLRVDGEDDPPGVRFHLEGDPHAVRRYRRGWVCITRGKGVAKRIEEDRLHLGTPGVQQSDAAMDYSLPASIDLRPLVGRRVILGLSEEPLPHGGRGQTLTVQTRDGRVWLVARYGGGGAVAYHMGGLEVRAALSPRHDGPLVVGTPDLQWLVPPGGTAHMKLGISRLVVEHVSRDGAGCGSYLVADRLLWH
ncbi:MAG TPA: hypothetical protein VIF15_02670 [Polyangiaceae bacterium]